MTNINNVDVQEVRLLKARLAEINKPLLSELEFTNGESELSVPLDILEWWEKTGLSNVDFVMGYLGGPRIDWDEWRKRLSLPALSEDKGSG